jgi:Haem-degrading
MVTLEDARKIIAAAERRAKEIGQPMNIAWTLTATRIWT